MPASYLVRFDDICPAMNWTVWKKIEHILQDSDVKPLLAVVPDNRDPHLEVGPRRDDFWHRVRDWQRRGWTIGLHGYQHRYESSDAGIVGRNRYSEFAGLSAEIQRVKIRNAVAIFAREGVTPEVWIAPAHSFDQNTLDVLKAYGIRRISDGYALRPWMDGRGMLWVPQQLGGFRPMPAFVWTVCLHHNGWGAADVRTFRHDIERYRSRISSFGEVAAKYETRRASFSDRLGGNAIRFARSLRLAAGGAR
jgi:predicted deacetylase